MLHFLFYIPYSRIENDTEKRTAHYNQGIGEKNYIWELNSIPNNDVNFKLYKILDPFTTQPAKTVGDAHLIIEICLVFRLCIMKEKK